MTSPPLGKLLASSDKNTRDKAIKDLSISLSNPSQDAFSELEMAKLWKGIFYCFWMSDKPLVQQELASEIAELSLTINSTSSSLSFLRGFWVSTVREWGGIDRLRIDKYYMLVRRFVNASFRLLMRAEWDVAVCRDYNNILTRSGGPLCPDDVRVPTSLAYHLSDIYLEELDKALVNSPTSPTIPVPITIIIAPFLNLAARTPAKTTYQRIQSALLEPLLLALENDMHSDSPPDSKRRKMDKLSYATLITNSCASDSTTEGPVSVTALRTKVLDYVFDVASEEGTKDSNRKKMYALWRTCAPDEADGSL